MSDIREDDRLIFPQKVCSGDYLFVYSAGENSVVVFIHPTPYSEDKPEAYMPYYDVVVTMGDDMMEAMELKNGNICDNYNSRRGVEHEIDDKTYSLSDALEQNTIDNIFMDL